mgnify:CR=1 FL=1
MNDIAKKYAELKEELDNKDPLLRYAKLKEELEQNDPLVRYALIKEEIDSIKEETSLKYEEDKKQQEEKTLEAMESLFHTLGGEVEIEESVAPLEGTDELVTKYKEETPGQGETEEEKQEKKEKSSVDVVAETISKHEKDNIKEEIDPVSARIEKLEKWIQKIAVAGPGSGEVRILNMDDVDTTDLANDKYLKYNSSTGKFVFATVSGGGSGGHTMQNAGSDLTARTNLNFDGTYVIATDDSGNDQTDIALSSALQSWHGKSRPSGDVIGTTDSQTLTNKTLTSPVLNTGVSGTAVLDEDNMASDSATQLATQQSIKAYVDAQILTEDTIAELNDTTISSADDGHFLVHTGSAWVNEAPATALASLGVTSSAAELNLLDGVSGLVQADLTKLAAVDSTAAELNIMDGGTSATSTTVADADRVVMNDNGTMVQVAVTDLSAYFDDEITAMPNLVTTAATTVGALNSGSITSGFGTIDTGSSTITTTGLISGGSLDIDHVLINGTTIGHTDDTDLITVADGKVTVAGELQATTLDIGGTNITSTAAELNLLDGSSAGSVVNSKGVIYSGTGTIAGTLSTAAQGNITSLGTLTTLTVDDIIINGTNIGHTSDSDAIAIASNGNVTISQDLLVSGDFTISGTTTTVNSTVTTVVDPIMTLQTATGGGALGSDSNKDVGLALQYHTGSAAKTAFLGFDDSTGKMIFVPDATINSEVVSGTAGTIVAALEGNATTATTLANARTLGGVSFDGSANINLPGVNSSGNQDTSGNAATATALATARTIGGTSFDGSANIAVALSATTTALASARTIGGVSFDGTANINLPGVNASGNQDTSGNADTATALATGRTIGMTGDVVWTSASFTGSGNVTGAATIQAGAVENSMLADDAVGADELASNAVVNASVASGAAIALTKLATTTASRVLETSGTGVISASDVTTTELALLDGSSAGSVVNSKAVIYSGTGTIAGTLSTAAQGNVTSLGTLTALTVDNVAINGTTIGHTSDTNLMTLADGLLTVAGEVSMTTLDIGGTNVTSTAAELNRLDGIGSAAVGLTDSQTMTNKTLTSPVINTGVSGSAVLDEDDMASDSATKIATQQSIKAYTDATSAAMAIALG